MKHKPVGDEVVLTTMAVTSNNTVYQTPPHYDLYFNIGAMMHNPKQVAILKISAQFFDVVDDEPEDANTRPATREYEEWDESSR